MLECNLYKYVHCTLYTVQCTVHCTLYTVHCTLYSTLYTVHYTLRCNNFLGACADLVVCRIFTESALRQVLSISLNVRWS